MATVYLANQESFDREVALKVMAPALAADKNYGERFMREARIAARFSQPNIIAVYDVGVQGDYYYIAMEYHPGGDLKERLKRNMTTRQAMSILRQIAAALDYAHNKGFIHRDVKPDNILFRDDGSAVLTDFGIARTVSGNTQMTQLGMVVGTPKYMSPEQARGQELDSRSDLYSLGIVFYEMLLGNVPFDGNDSIAIGIKHVKEPVPLLPAQLSALQPLVDGLLAKTPEQRYATGRELITDLDQLRLGGLKNQKRDEAIVESPSATKEIKVEPTPEPDPVKPHRSDPGGKTSSTPHHSGPAKIATWLLLPLAIGAGYYAWTNGQLDKLQQQISDSQYYQRTLTMIDQWLIGDESIPVQPPGRQPEIESALPSALELSTSRLSSQLLGEAISAQVFPAHAVSGSIAIGATAALADIDPDALPIIDMQSRAINQMLSEARSLMVAGQLVTPPDDNALQLYQQVLELEQGNPEAEAGQLIIAKHFASLADKALTTNSLDVAASYLQQATDLAPQLEQLKPLQLQLDQAVTEHQNSVAAAKARAVQESNRAQSMLDRFKITGLLRSAEYDIAEKRYTSPADNSALQKYRTVLQVDPANPEAREGLATLAKKLQIEIETAAATDDTKRLAKLLAELRLVDPKSPTLQQPSAAP